MGGDRAECSDPKYKEKKESVWRERESQIRRGQKKMERGLEAQYFL